MRITGLILLFAGAAALLGAQPRQLPLAFERMSGEDVYVLRGTAKHMTLLPGQVRMDGPARNDGAFIGLRFGGDKLLPVGEGAQPTEVGYYLGNDPKKWFRTRQYRSVRYRDTAPASMWCSIHRIATSSSIG